MTTMHDPSNDLEMVFANAEMTRAGLKLSPRLFSTGRILYGAETRFKAPVESYEDALSHIRRLKAIGAPSVKSYNQQRRDARQMLLKAALLERSGDIRNPTNGFTHSIEYCLNKATNDGEIKFLSGDERQTFQVLNGLRDQAQHYLVDVSEQILYTVSQGAVTLFADLLPRLFGIPLCSRLPKRVLPISVNPPQDIHILMDDEFTDTPDYFFW